MHSNQAIHDLVLKNLKESPMYDKKLLSKGPRYCPSFEDKVIKFSDKNRHQIFLEPESLSLNTIYLQGFSTSMPEKIQRKMVKLLPGFKNAEFIKYAYAIEYDAIDPTQMYHSLESKLIKNFYSAGQINGTSGYEEAAAQGLMAGINATLSIDDKPPLILRRDEAYIGVMIDDLVLKGTKEPYRLLTSRAEYRLMLRNDNAEKRLKKYAYQLNLVDDLEWKNYLTQQIVLNKTIEELKKIKFTSKSKLQDELIKLNFPLIKTSISGYDLIKRPQVSSDLLSKYLPIYEKLPLNIKTQILVLIRFEGYILKQQREVIKSQKLENLKLDQALNYQLVPNLSYEAIEKLNVIKPLTIGQATRVPGIKPSDIQMLIYYLAKKRK